MTKPSNSNQSVLFCSFTLLASIAWIGYRLKQKKKQTFYTIKNIKDCRHLMQQAEGLLQSEFDRNIQYLTLDGKGQTIEAKEVPCHRVLFKIEPRSIFDLSTLKETLIAHVSLSDAGHTLSPERLRTMLKINMLPHIIKTRAKLAGLDLNEQRFYDKDGNLTFDWLRDSDFPKEAYIGSLVVHRKFRRCGFAKVLLSEALLFLHSEGYTKVVGTANRQLVPFYEHLGGSKEIKRTFTSNSISVKIDEEVIAKCRKILQKGITTLRL